MVMLSKRDLNFILDTKDESWRKEHDRVVSIEEENTVLREALKYARECLLGQCESDHPAIRKADFALSWRRR